MTPPKRTRQRANLTAKDRKTLEEAEARVNWIPFVSFNRDPDPDNPKDHGDRPYEPGPSLMDMERRGSVIVSFTYSWPGAIQLEVNDGTNTVTVMLDRVQEERLMEGLTRWHGGLLQDWLTGVADAAVTCEHCEGRGLKPAP